MHAVFNGRALDFTYPDGFTVARDSACLMASFSTEGIAVLSNAGLIPFGGENSRPGRWRQLGLAAIDPRFRC